MGFRFSKRIKLIPDVQLNLSRSGIGVSIGGKGQRVSNGPKGVRITANIPGTGIRFIQQLGKKKSK